VNARLQLLLGTLALAIAFPGFGTLSRTELEQGIQQQMNDGSGAYVTSDVRCVRKNAASAGVRYACSLHGVGAPPLRVRVDVNGSDWRAHWAPVSG
jgi:hypothetical protein